jgi:(4S)-4-hydroxy-5-phosphonooxypentane-2,3-dione isomerase
MYAILVTIRIKPEFREPFIESMLDDARGSVNDEPGCFRFDVLQDDKNPNTIYLYEVYRDRSAFDAHLVAPHYTYWRDTVNDWYASPNQVVNVTPIYPAPAGWTK